MRLSELVLKISKTSVALGFVFLSVTAAAKAPLTTDHLVTPSKKTRYPAGLAIAPLDNYMDMQCRDFYDESNKDEFVLFFRKGLESISRNFCDQVRDVEFEEDISQSQQKFVGAGTFSKLMESHYNEFKYVKQLSHYQDQDCNQLVDEESHDEFGSFFRDYIDQLNPNLCGLVRADAQMDDDRGQAQREFIGLGTFSKIVEEAFNEYYFSHKQ